MQPDWEIWLDVNLSPAIAKWMKEYTGLVVKSSYALSYQTLKDLEIYQTANKHGKVILISKDTDFPELINRLGAPPKLINIKIGNCDNRKLWSLLKPQIMGMVNTLTSTDTDIIEFE